MCDQVTILLCPGTPLSSPAQAGPLVSIRDIWSPSSGAGGRQPLPLTARARPELRCGCIPLPDAAAALPGPHTTTRQMSNLADVGPELRAGTGVGFHLTLGQHIMKKFLVIIPALLGTYLALHPMWRLFHNFLVQASPRRISPEAMWPRRPTRCRCPRRAPRCRPTTPSTTTPTSPRPSPSPRWTGEL